MSLVNSTDKNEQLDLEKQLTQLANNIKAWGHALGFQQVGICDIDLNQHKKALLSYLSSNYHGSMSYLDRNVDKRLDPNKLYPGTCRIISVRMNYLPPKAEFAKNLSQDKHAFISRYAIGRDYHKLMRNRLKKLGEKIKAHCSESDYRPFVDSAPVLEHGIAHKAGIGWTGKHTLTLNKEAGSWFFLGELFINLPLPVDQPSEDGCGSCTACISICPTQAIIEPYKLDARKCISYLTIEHKGTIDIKYRKAMGNRIYGCDDCQLVCPWNRYASVTTEKDFFRRECFTDVSLVTLFEWSEDEFLTKTQGSPIRRIGVHNWRRNISVAMGNAPYDPNISRCLLSALKQEKSEVLIEHYQWALEQQTLKKEKKTTVDNRQQERLIRIIQKGLPRDA